MIGCMIGSMMGKMIGGLHSESLPVNPPLPVPYMRRPLHDQ